MKRLTLIIVILIGLFLWVGDSAAFWVWTPETNKWVNPKYAVKDTPAEQLSYAQEFYTAGDLKKAMAEFNKLIAHYPRARQAADAQFYLGVCNYDLGNLFLAFKAYQLVIEKYPFSDRSEEIIKRQYQIGNELMEGKGKGNAFIDTLRAADYDVIEIFRMIIKNAPYGEYAPSAQYKIGLYLLEKQLYQEARDEFEKLMNDYPETEWAKAAKYQIAVSDAKRSTSAGYDQRVTKAAVKEFKEFVKHYPDAELSADAHKQINSLREKEAENNFLVAKFYVKQKKYKAAEIYYTTVIEEFSETTWAEKAKEKIEELRAMPR